jgi:hypothetical protein
MNRKKLLLAMDRTLLEKYGFFYHRASNAWWYMFNPSVRLPSNVELSLRLYDDSDELRLYATNDHIKLPSIYSNKYNKNNYLEIEDELDKFSFEEWIQLGILFELINDGIFKFTKTTVIKPKRKKTVDIIQETLNEIATQTLDTPKE